MAMKVSSLLALILLSTSFVSLAAADSSATITEARGTVGLGKGKPPAPERTARVNDALARSDYLRTAVASLAELKFANDTLTRVGPLSVFRFSPQSSNFILERGEGLFVFPKGRGGSAVSTPAFAAGILGTTVYVKATRSEIEYACLEGRCRVGPHVLIPGDKLVLRGTRVAYTVPKQRFDLAKFLATNPLVGGYTTPLPSRALIEAEAATQAAP